MSSQNISTQPTAAPAMQMNIEPESGKQNQTRFQSLRLRGGGAAKGCLIGALSCFICCEACQHPLNVYLSQPPPLILAVMATKEMKVFTREEVAKHNKEGDLASLIYIS
ncbi:unnamed protein product [Rhizoctonia solani]|uniref:Uncharacterized protein n=1 Tax=Rhizoctonia solani TaxID=456999 RepID=A0A8H3AS93_9AGAM|nr:unnamed protein product [Rhizoctonia solani]